MDAPVLTLDQIKATYPDEWVLVQRVKLDRHGFMKTGRVAFHSTDRDAVYSRAMELPPPLSVAIYHTTGPVLADDEAFAL